MRNEEHYNFTFHTCKEVFFLILPLLHSSVYKATRDLWHFVCYKISTSLKINECTLRKTTEKFLVQILDY